MKKEEHFLKLKTRIIASLLTFFWSKTRLFNDLEPNNLVEATDLLCFDYFFVNYNCLVNCKKILKAETKYKL